jgi:hypothetical protein
VLSRIMLAGVTAAGYPHVDCIAARRGCSHDADTVTPVRRQMLVAVP